jgi:hypothetical protein
MSGSSKRTYRSEQRGRVNYPEGRSWLGSFVRFAADTFCWAFACPASMSVNANTAASLYRISRTDSQQRACLLRARESIRLYPEPLKSALS